MSLEQTIADLVAASNNLTGSVNNKMNEIDQKVDQATQAVPDTIRSLSEQVFYIDGEVGDDENNDGSFYSPFKTVWRTFDEAIDGSKIVVYLREGQTFLCSGSNAKRAASGYWSFQRWGNTGGIGKPVIRHVNEYRESYNMNRGAFMAIDVGVVYVENVDFEVVNADNGVKAHHNDGLFYTYLTSTTVFFFGSQITLHDRDIMGLAEGGRTELSVYLNETSIIIDESSVADGSTNKVIRGNSSVYTLGVGSVTLPAGKSWPDMVPIQSDFSNITTNLDTTTITI